MPAMLPGRGLLIGVLFLLVPLCVTAQTAADAPRDHHRLPLSVGGEIMMALGPPDESAYFNYTGYETNALRTSRVRLMGEWRLAPAASVVGELRLDGASELTVPAVYLRWQPVASRPLHVQIGRIPPLIGAFARRAYGRDNAVIGLPLAYQYLTSLRDDALPYSIDDVTAMRGRGWASSYPVAGYQTGPGVPLVAVAEWDTGVEATWQSDRVTASAAVTLGAPSVPVVRDTNDGLMVSGRVSLFAPGGVTIGASAGRGAWMDRDALDFAGLNDDVNPSQGIVGADAEYGYGAWLVRAEVLRSTFVLPLVATAPGGVNLAAWSTFGEVRYRPHPRWQLGMRVGRLDFSRVDTADSGAGVPWEAPVRRIETAITYRVTRAIDIRAGWQHNWREGGRVRERGFPVISALLWF
jgi:hypothetical protein